MLDAPGGCRSRMYVGSKVFAMKSQLAGEIILCDNGACISCITSTDGRLPGTGSQEDAGPLTIGDTSSSLRSEGTHWHAMELRSDNGQSEDSLLHMHFTPNSIANIRSETQEVEQRGSRIEQVPGQPRKWHTGKGACLSLRMGQNGLGFLTMVPIVDWSRIQRLLDENDDVRLMVEASSEYRATLAPVALAPVVHSLNAVGLERVPRDEYLAALYRAAMGTPLSTDEVILSHAVSRGVENVETSVVLSRLQNRLAAGHVLSAPSPQSLAHLTALTRHTMDGRAATAVQLNAAAAAHVGGPVPIGLAAPALCRSSTGVGTQQDQHIMMLIRKGGISYDMVAAATAAAMSLVGMGHAGRIPTLAPLEMLTRMHIVLGHAPLQIILATLAQCATVCESAEERP